MARATQTQLRLPQIQRVKLRRFSLFTANPDAEFSAGDGVLCLIGANGIGKSTLLSAINFCLTGIVPDPTRTFASMDEYYKFTRAYSANYFRGRILGSDEDDAEITLVFRIGSVTFEVCRGLFEPNELRALTIDDANSHSQFVATEDTPRSERHRQYVESIVANVGVSSFEEFVFLQHFVFTFDEQRKTLFWNPPIMERALYRAFGLDPSMAKQVDSIRREIQQEDSRVRNYQWEATRMRKRITEIRAQNQQLTGAQEQYETLVADHEQLSGQFDEESKRLHETENALRDAHLRLADLSVRETALREEYARFFDSRFDLRPPLAQHPLILQSVSSHTCGLCGNTGTKVVETLSQRAGAQNCPLCGSEVKIKRQTATQSSRLREIDRELAQLKKSLKDSHLSIESLRRDEGKARTTWETTKEKLDQFDQKNSTLLDTLRKELNRNAPEISLSDYREQLAVLEREKKAAYDQREALKRQLLGLQRTLEQQYIEVEEKFVPLFSRLAQHFLGMPLSVEMDARASESVKLIVSVRGTVRRQQQHLSESQRFFLDIALRMALTQYMSAPESLGGMFIDTPEGSLDIAYEKRAGDMLAMFAIAGHQIVMTANLNSSKLLLALAHECGRKRLQLCRMMDWAELSDVQQEEEQLFDEAYQAIETAMGN